MINEVSYEYVANFAIADLLSAGRMTMCFIFSGKLWRSFSYQVTLDCDTSSASDRGRLAQYLLQEKYYDHVAQDALPSLVTLLSQKAIGLTFAALDGVLHEAVLLACEALEPLPCTSDALSLMQTSDVTLPNGAMEVALAINLDGECSNPSQDSRALMTEEHLEAALALYNKEKRKDVSGSVEVPKVHWQDVGGLEHAKRELVNAIQLPLRYPHLMAAGANRSG